MKVEINLPEWLEQAVSELPALPTMESRMAAMIEFSRTNFQRDTGGPFAAGVFDVQSGQAIAIGVNRVVPTHCSSAHAEIVALSLAQQAVGQFDLGGPGLPRYELVVNWRPCAMCFGAVFWSGIRSLVIAGADHQLEEITGFDEGPIHPQWREQLEARGISLVEDVLKEEACGVFREFRDAGKLVYNGRQGK